MKRTRLLLSLCFVFAATIVALAQRPSASFDVPSTLKCSNNPVSLTSTSTIGLGSIVQEKWIFFTGNPGDTVVQMGGQNTVNFKLDDGSYIVNLIAFGPDGQSDTTDGIVRIEVAPVAGFSSDVPCFPNTVLITDTSKTKEGTITSIEWQVAGLSSTNNTFNYSGSTGTFPVQLAVLGSNGCRDTINETITYTNEPILSFSPSGPLTLCQGDSIEINPSGADRYVWFDNTTTDNYYATTSGFKSVEGFTSAQCSAKDSILVNTVPKPEAMAGADVSIASGESTTLLGSGGISYSWMPTTGLSDARIANPVANPSNTTEYILTVTDANDCSDSDTLLITVDETTTIPVHNMLTPNGDGFNDTWDLSSVPGIENAKIYVLNRWGWEVFKAEDGYNNDWDGTVANEPLPDGSYLYVIQFNDDNKEPLRGALQIIRNLQK